MPSNDTADAQYRLRRLTASDADMIHSLYSKVFVRTPTGFLARRTRADFDRMFHAENFAGGAFDGDRLAGYQIYNTVRELRFNADRYRLAASIVSGERVVFGKGTVIDLDHQGAGLAPRISQLTSDLGKAAGYRYRIGHAFLANTNSLKYQLGSGRTIVGLSEDEFGLNFITCGFLGPIISRTETGLCPVDDIERIAKTLESERIIDMRNVNGVPSYVIGTVVEG